MISETVLRVSVQAETDLSTSWCLYYDTSSNVLSDIYYYSLNSRGDVVGLYNANGALSSTYEYDAYGKLLSVKTPVGIEITGETSVAILNPLRYRGYVYDNETGFYYLQSRYYDPVICRFISADKQLNTNTFTGHNQFAYCDNNPTNYVDYTGEDASAVLGGWASSMWWLHFVDGPFPIGDIIYWGVVGITGGAVIIGAINSTSSSVSTNTSSKPTTQTNDSDQTAVEPDTPSTPDIPDVKYPGNDPNIAPEGTEWRGKGTPDDGGGNYYNPKTKEYYHPDLKHPGDIGPHWDYNYKGSGTKGWRLFPDGRIEPKAFAKTWSLGDTIEIF